MAVKPKVILGQEKATRSGCHSSTMKTNRKLDYCRESTAEQSRLLFGRAAAPVAAKSATSPSIGRDR